jgi:hypothetical protein
VIGSGHSRSLRLVAIWVRTVEGERSNLHDSGWTMQIGRRAGDTNGKAGLAAIAIAIKCRSVHKYARTEGALIGRRACPTSESPSIATAIPSARRGPKRPRSSMPGRGARSDPLQPA